MSSVCEVRYDLACEVVGVAEAAPKDIVGTPDQQGMINSTV